MTPQEVEALVLLARRKPDAVVTSTPPITVVIPWQVSSIVAKRVIIMLTRASEFRFHGKDRRVPVKITFTEP